MRNKCLSERQQPEQTGENNRKPPIAQSDKNQTSQR